MSYGGFLVWKPLLFCLSLGGCDEFDLYPRRGISKIHQGIVRGKWEDFVSMKSWEPWMLNNVVLHKV